jgi:membrane-associated phospholipid phosphatase
MYQISSLYYQKYPFIFEYFNILRDILLVLQLFIIIIFIFYSRNWKNFSYYFIIFIFTIIFTFLIKSYFPVLRPNGLSFDSFPSSHTAISSALSFALIWQNLKLGIFSFILTFLIIILSIISLSHWPIDIFFGFIFGFLIFFGNSKYFKFF